MYCKALLIGATLWLSHCNQDSAKLNPTCSPKPSNGTVHTVPDTGSTLAFLTLACGLTLAYRRVATR
jgi:hypothetical protein